VNQQRGETVDTRQDAKQKLLKALVVLDSRENSWFLNGGFHESIDCHLIDVKGLPVNMEDQHGTLALIAQQSPDVLLLDSTLARSFVLGIVIEVREKMPGLPVVLLPDIHRDVEHAAGNVERAAELRAAELPGAGGNTARVGADTDNGLDSGPMADTIARTIRYTHGQLGLQRTLLQMALRDDLTGLHNRRGFTALATRHLRWARDTGQHMAMFFADLDGLKLINDRFGHAEGDQAISLAAACIKETFRKFDVTARLSGDEFVALIMEEPGRSAETICRRLHMNLAEGAGADSPYKLSLSVGVSHFDPGAPVTLQELMKQADTALYQHKRKKYSSAPGGLAAVKSAAPLALNPSTPRR
jgi:diguanylate cyclase (GGDEF)-like protein